MKTQSALLNKPLLLACAALLSLPAFAADNLLQNGEFTAEKLVPWKVFSGKGTPQSTKGEMADGGLVVRIVEACEKPWERQLMQKVDLEPGAKYLLTFEARTESPDNTEIIVTASRDDEKEHVGLRKRELLLDTWTKHKVHFVANEKAADGEVALKFFLGQLSGDAYFRNISLVNAGAEN